MAHIGELVYDFAIINFETAIFIYFAEYSIKKHTVVVRIMLIVVLSLLHLIKRMVLPGGGITNLIVETIVDVIYLLAIYKGGVLISSMVVGLFYAIIFLADVSVALVFACIASSLEEHILAITLFSKGVLLPVLWFFKRKVFGKFDFTDSMVFIFVPALLVVTAYISSPYNQDFNDPDKAALLIAQCIISIIAVYLVVLLLKRNFEKKQLQEQLELNINHYKEVYQAHSEKEKLAHDMSYHLNYMAALDDIESVKEYIQKMHNIGFGMTRKFTGNFDIDVVLNANYSKMEENGITLQVNNILPKEIAWIDAVDINIILGNSLSNAIEASEKCGGTEISVNFNYEGNWLLISVVNTSPYEELPKKTPWGYLSSKESSRYGIGMVSLLSSVDKYDGSAEIDIKDGKFILTIMLQK